MRKQLSMLTVGLTALLLAIGAHSGLRAQEAWDVDSDATIAVSTEVVGDELSADDLVLLENEDFAAELREIERRAELEAMADLDMKAAKTDNTADRLIAELAPDADADTRAELEALIEEELELADLDYWDDPAYADIDDSELLDRLIMEEEEAALRAGREFESSLIADFEGFNAAGDPSEVDDLFAREFGVGADMGPYRLRISDKLFISIYGEPGTGRAVRIDHTGHVDYLLVGRVFALGKTIDQLRATLNESLQSYFKHAKVAITPVQFGSQHFTILGQVGSPGKKVLRGETTLIEALAMAGGFSQGEFRSQTIELADLGHAFLARKGEYMPIDFVALHHAGDMSQNVTVQPGDYIHVPSVLYREIHILGEVKAPTTIGYINIVSLVEAIAQARGLTDRASSRIVVCRGSLSDPETFFVDINLILRGFEPDFVLQPGDIVYAPPRRFQNLREVTHMAIRSFVGVAAGIAGDHAFKVTHPHAKDDELTNTIPGPSFQ